MIFTKYTNYRMAGSLCGISGGCSCGWYRPSGGGGGGGSYWCGPSGGSGSVGVWAETARVSIN